MQSAEILTNQDERICINTIYALRQHGNGYMATGAIGHTHVQLHVTGIQAAKEYSSYQ